MACVRFTQRRLPTRFRGGACLRSSLLCGALFRQALCFQRFQFGLVLRFDSRLLFAPLGFRGKRLPARFGFGGLATGFRFRRFLRALACLGGFGLFAHFALLLGTRRGGGDLALAFQTRP